MMPLLNVARTLQSQNVPRRFYATEIEIKKQEQNAVDIDQRNKKLGVDMAFNEQKHAYVLTFPWNF
jgi:hypothetical protein